ncbi:helix-turn-helix transcriptional regulator [Actinoplanes sp. NPDC049596]|uniref:helix-turn-helix domain-containing protein n=1 Tax=unclassified Actinoplanes TaxID=2626549 RepID=UPI0034420575
MEIAELGSELRRRRAAAGRTIASVAADAGLSVPYIANLENGRGNPTLSAVSSLAAALGAQLTVSLTEGGAGPAEPLPDSLVRFSREPRFRAEVTHLAAANHAPAADVGARLLTAMAAMASLAPRPPTDLDWHRLLDTVVLLTRA